jgi:hypothetical protein
MRSSHTSQGSTPPAVRQVTVPTDARAICTLDRIDYADAFEADVGPPRRRTAEQWARAVLEDAPAGLRGRLVASWCAIGLKLSHGRSHAAVLGWQIRCNVPEFVLVGADSRIGMPAELLFRRLPDRLLFCTFVQHDNPTARAVWAGVERAHVPAVHRLLDLTSSRQRQ